MFSYIFHVGISLLGSKLFGKIGIFWQNCKFLTKLKIFDKIEKFWQNRKILTK